MFDNGILGGLVGLIQSHPGWLIGLAFLFAFLEALALVGLIMPGVVLLFLVGAVVGFDGPLFISCWLAAMAGALAGDWASYWLGRRFSAQVTAMWPLSRHPELLGAGERMFLRHGGKGVFIGRFVGPIRPVLPLVAGMMRMPQANFLFFAVPACFLWAPLYLLPGMLFGASLELAAEFAGRLVVLLVILVLGGWFLLWATGRIYSYAARRSRRWLSAMIRWSAAHPRLGPLLGPLLQPGGRELISVAVLGVVLLVSIAALLTVLVSAPFARMTWDAEMQFAGLAASLRNHLADPVFVAVALAGSLESMALLAAAMAVLLIGLGRIASAWHWMAAVVGAWLLSELLNALMLLFITVPPYAPALGELPSRAFTLATVVLMFFAVMLAKDLRPRHRPWPYLLAAALCGLVGFAIFYLQQASLSGLFAALALGLGWVALVGMAYRQRARRRRFPTVLALSFAGLLIGIGVVQVQRDFDALLASSRLTLPERELAVTDWIAGEWRDLPDRLSRLGRADRARFDLQFAGDLFALQQALAAQGWAAVPQPQPRDMPAMLVSSPDSGRLPHMSKDFAGRPDNLMMRRELDGGEVLLLRLWASGARLSPAGQPIWLGQVRQLRPGLAFGWLGRWQEVEASRERAAEALAADIDAVIWQPADDRFRLYLSLPEASGLRSSSVSSVLSR